MPGGGTHIVSVRARAAEQGIIFRIPTPGQGVIFVQIGSMTGFIFVISFFFFFFFDTLFIVGYII